MESKSALYSYYDCELPHENYYREGRYEEQQEYSFGSHIWNWTLSVVAAVQLYLWSALTFANSQVLRETWYATSKKSWKRTVRGMRRAARRTFRKLFGEKSSCAKKSRRNDFESTKYITDKMLSSSEQSSSSDTEGGASHKQYFKFNVERGASSQGGRQQPASILPLYSQEAYRKLE